jgi:plasmid maintenance system antidote protein VapI
MQTEGITKAQIARALGLRQPLLQLRLTADARITARNAVRIKRLHYRWMVEGSEGQDQPNV